MTTYPVVEIFGSQQGEGFYTGRDCVFIRLAGCNKNCTWCDTDWCTGDSLPIIEILSAVAHAVQKVTYVVITGGEPSIHDVRPLLQALRNHFRAVKIGVESNGTGTPYFYSQFDYVAISPKEDWFGSDHARILTHPEALRVIKECRIVCTDGILPHMLYAVPSEWRRYLSPLWDISSKNGDGCFDMQNLYRLYDDARDDGWGISFQTHKLARIR